MIFWHLGGALFLFRWIFRDPKVDVRLLFLGVLLPDAIDFVLGLFLGDVFRQRLGHTLLLPVVYAAAVLLATRRGRRRRALMTVAIGWLFHLVLDGMWTRPETLFWPAFGWEFAPWPAGSAWERALADPWRWLANAAGLAYLLVIWRRLGEAGRRQVVTTGRLPAWVAALALIAACGSTPGGTVTTVASAASPETVASRVLDGVSGGRYEEAAALTLLDQMPWVALMEGASAAEAAGLFDQSGAGVAANFWEGFGAAGLGPFEVEEARLQTLEGVDFALVPVRGSSAASRLVLVDDGGWKVDVVASFGAGLADRLLEAVEMAETASGPGAGRLRQALGEQMPSVRIAMTEPGLPPEVADSLGRLLTRLELLTG
jgi:hypothetical protein